MMTTMNELYKTKISNARWWAYDIPGNIGWIIWLICLGMCLKAGPDLFALLAMITAVLMVIKVGELVSERIAKLDRVLPKLRVWRGFGALALGGILGIAVAIVGLVMKLHGPLPAWMLCGATLCAVFAGLCLRGYKRQDNEG